jgi:hypothetical protein
MHHIAHLIVHIDASHIEHDHRFPTFITSYQHQYQRSVGRSVGQSVVCWHATEVDQ